MTEQSQSGAAAPAVIRAITPGLVFALLLCACLALQTTAVAGNGPDMVAGSPLDRGFIGLYNLDFPGAQKNFAQWEQQHPDDPLGPASEAAGFLFSEFDRLGVLEAQFFSNDDAFAKRSAQTPDPAIRDRFYNALNRAETLAHARLMRDGKDRDALFAITLSSGLQADYAALIEKRNLASLHFTKEASATAQQLLSVCSDCYDALLATGFSKYIIGSMSAPVRWVLRMGGMPADKQQGIADLQLTAQRGHYLAPFARILLAIAYVREKDNAQAIFLLNGLKADFPGNSLFDREISRLQANQAVVKQR
jgi:hypothetical protein